MSGSGMLEISVKLSVVPKSAVCNGPYKPGPANDLTPEIVDSKPAIKKAVSDVYKLRSGKTTPLALQPHFQQALIPGIRDGNYAVLLEFDWGDTLGTLRIVVDFVPGPTNDLPEWSKKEPAYHKGRYWYAHQNASEFDPGRSVTWQVTLNGPAGSSFLFYAVPAR